MARPTLPSPTRAAQARSTQARNRMGFGKPRDRASMATDPYRSWNSGGQPLLLEPGFGPARC